ncbi:MAG: 2-oxoacid:acceptor oxidoreductase subunit alpha [Candidatus Omnitrophica bacterium]|nr:2-oxoacid:acceptor oxidoreductase subunit alpha [Candidatus Omnitrophota bacterium]
MSQTRAELSVWVGGAAGDGIAASGESFAKACARSGYHVFAYNSYQSAIRGGHVCMHIRVGRQKVWTHGDGLQYLVALNADSVERYAARVPPGGAILYNRDKFDVKPERIPQGVQAIGLPVMELVGNQLMQNIALMGALYELLGLDAGAFKGLIRERFAKKGEGIVATNLSAFDKGAAFARAHAQPGGIRIGASDGKHRLVASGNALIAFGAVAAGCRFYAAYPMTPASSILHWMAKNAVKTGTLVKQAEDEIAVLNMAIGASHAGVRAMCATSGGGFALMSEAVGEAAMTETPVVVVEVQRAGPSTGVPTKTEQADLFQLLGASQGDFPKIILAPRTFNECYSMTIQAFNLADKYQCPVLLSSDLYLSERNETFEGLDITNIPIERGEIVTEANGEPYRRFLDTKTGVSPRALPGTPGTVYVAATDEHDPDGVVISDVFTNPSMRAKMMEKRMRKLDHILKELPEPELEGPKDADLTLIGWGSTYAVLVEAMQALNQEGLSAKGGSASGGKVNVFAPRALWPFKGEATRRLLERCTMTLAVEANYIGQLAKLIRMETGLAIQHHLHKYDGEPFEPAQVIAHARKLLKTKPKESTVASVVSDEGLPPDFSPIAAPGSEAVRVH